MQGVKIRLRRWARVVLPAEAGPERPMRETGGWSIVCEDLDWRILSRDRTKMDQSLVEGVSPGSLGV